MNRFVSLLVVAGFVMAPAVLMAQDTPKVHGQHKDRAAGGKVEAPAQEMTFTGKITKEERKGAEGKTWSRYVLTTAEGLQVVLPEQKKDAPGAIKYEDFVNADAKLVAKAREIQREGKKVVKVVEIVTLEKVVAAPAAVPAA